MLIDDCKACDKHNSHGNGFVICTYWNMNEQRITRTEANNKIVIISCPRENDLTIDNKNDLRPRWNKSV